MIVIQLILIILSFLYWPYVDVSPIVGGQIISKASIKYYSYVTSLQEFVESENGTSFQHICGGSMISENWLLTAAHCVSGKDPSNLVVSIGERFLLSKNLVRYDVLRYEVGDFQPYTLRHDIALIEINRNESTSTKNRFFNPIQLPPSSSVKLNYAKPCKIVGYGASQFGGELSNRLYSAKVKILKSEKCFEILGNMMSPKEGDNTICALGIDTDACQGDSGGPLICTKGNKEFIYGIVSHGLSCGSKGVPSIYTIVDKYLYWINNIIKTKNNNT